MQKYMVEGNKLSMLCDMEARGDACFNREFNQDFGIGSGNRFLVNKVIHCKSKNKNCVQAKRFK